MATYKIKCSYKTGDSFRSEDAQRELEMEWESLANAKAALKRIEEHYRWYEQENDSYRQHRNEEPIPEPEWHKGEKYDFIVKLLLDNGNEVQFSAPWCGYFESLYGAEIVVSNDGMSFEI
jgi:hypothetical protein